MPQKRHCSFTYSHFYRGYRHWSRRRKGNLENGEAGKLVLIEIDPSDRELFLLVKDIIDNPEKDIEQKVLINLLREKGKKVRLNVDADGSHVYIEFVKRKKFGLF